MELFKASRQWAVRPDDERFWTLEEMYATCRGYADNAAEATHPWHTMTAVPDGDEVALVGTTGTKATMTHYAFGQLAAKVQAPASYLRRLPSALASDCLNNGLQAMEPERRPARLLFHQNGGLVVRAATTDVYQRYWNYQLCTQLMALATKGWRTAPAFPTSDNTARQRKATADDCGPWTYVQPGDTIAPAGLYASDHDMFVFLLHPDRVVDDTTGKPLFRGFFAWNSEVGDKAIGIMSYLYEASCGNHIIWGAKNVVELTFRHVGQLDGKIGQLRATLTRYADESMSEEQAIIRKARTFVIAKTKEEIIDRLFKLRIAALTRPVLEAGYDMAERNQFDPTTAWGMVQGLTRVSQTTAYADTRNTLDRAAGKVLQIVF